jgi:hypothetical protein
LIESSVVETIAGRIEQELARVRAARPALASRVSRAENILVTHLSCRRQRTIRVRVRDGRPRFLVSGSGGAVYVVDPSDWSCTCPDHHRRGAGCKHALACWALWRASARPAQGVEGFGRVGEIVGRAVPMTRRCDGCGDRFVERDLIEVGPEQAEWTLTAFEGDELCRQCAHAHGVL